MRRLLVSLCILLIIVEPGLAQVPDDRLVVPGERIGKWKLQMSLGDLARELQPGSASPVAIGIRPPEDSGHVSGILLYFFSGSNFLAAGSRDGQRIEFLEVSQPQFKTAKDIGIESSRDAVFSAYGTPSAEMTVGAQRRPQLLYDEIGLGFLFLETRVTHVVIFRPGSARSIWRF